jgi:UDP-glucose 4-epimerase
VFHAAALKQVPNCEYFPGEAVATNVGGAINIARAVQEHDLPIEAVVGISTDKACHPVNVMGMTKAIQERVFISANLGRPRTRFACARYGNVLASRGSVVPLFHSQIRAGGPVTITTREMTRHLLSLDQAVTTVIDAYRLGRAGEIFVPRAPSSKITMIAECLIGDRRIETVEIGIRPGEKVHEILVAEDEAERTVTRDGYYVIRPALPELGDGTRSTSALRGEYSSRDSCMDKSALAAMLRSHRLRIEDEPDFAAAFGAPERAPPRPAAVSGVLSSRVAD